LAELKEGRQMLKWQQKAILYLPFVVGAQYLQEKN